MHLEDAKALFAGCRYLHYQGNEKRNKKGNENAGNKYTDNNKYKIVYNWKEIEEHLEPF
jgi:hypothetical protein